MEPTPSKIVKLLGHNSYTSQLKEILLDGRLSYEIINKVNPEKRSVFTLPPNPSRAEIMELVQQTILKLKAGEADE